MLPNFKILSIPLTRCDGLLKSHNKTISNIGTDKPCRELNDTSVQSKCGEVQKTFYRNIPNIETEKSSRELCSTKSFILHSVYKDILLNPMKLTIPLSRCDEQQQLPIQPINPKPPQYQIDESLQKVDNTNLSIQPIDINVVHVKNEEVQNYMNWKNIKVESDMIENDYNLITPINCNAAASEEFQSKKCDENILPIRPFIKKEDNYDDYKLDIDMVDNLVLNGYLKQESLDDIEHLQNENTVSPSTQNIKTCDICKKTYSTKSKLRTHIFTHLKKNCDKFNMCDNSSSQKLNLSKPVTVESKTKQSTYICSKKCSTEITNIDNICNVTKISDLKIDNENLSKNNRKLKPCSICKIIFPSTSSRSKSKHNKKLYSCKVCKTPFNKKIDIINYILILSGGKILHECDICDTSFCDNSTLTRHKKNVHKMLKKHKCDVCKISFFKSKHLQRHMLIHTLKKLYSCNICKKSFSQKSSMKSHKKNHFQV